MKKLFLTLALAAATISSASAATFFYNGILMGNVCRSGLYYTVYPISMSQPVGSKCPVRDPYGYIIAVGQVTNE